MAVLHARFQDAVPPREGQRTCPECLKHFTPAQEAQLFCSSAHRAAWNNRMTVRGRVATPLLMAARHTRNGTRGRSTFGYRASIDLDRLLARWRREDAREGRMSAVEYNDRRYRLGFDPL